MVVGLSKKGHSRTTSSSVSPLASSIWRFPIRSDSLPFVKSTPNHHIVHSDGTQQSIEKLKDYLRTESELSSGIPNTQDGQVTPIRRKPSTFSLNVLEDQVAHGHRGTQQLNGGPANNYMLYCNSLLQLADGSVHMSHVLPAFTESTDSLSDETYASQLDGPSLLNRKYSDRFVKDLLREAEAKHQREIETLKQELHSQLSKQSQEAQTQIDRHKTEVNELTAERDEMQFMLEEYIATSGRLIEQKESETDVLTRELGKTTLERQRLQKSLEESESRADALSSERKEAQERIESLVAENVRLEALSNDLRNDVLVAEERNELIKKHAQVTLDKANAEITKMHDLLAQTKHDVTSLQTQTSKVDARAKSLQIQLNSTRQQNKDLLDLCERLESSLV
ncbi:hypothetical protein EV179_003385 [Coemansia sp. RSA 487]|nr:hypothetical protein EV179_003385 [Coemansia sp. RSA 487]